MYYGQRVMPGWGALPPPAGQDWRRGGGVTGRRPADITPSAARLTESLRDIGYDFPAAVADIVDNSVAAGASRVEVTIGFDAGEACVVIADDGMGMTSRT